MVASHYGYKDGFDGRTMANGEIFRAFTPYRVNQEGVSIWAAAHKTLPEGTLIRATNPDTNATIWAEITDRGPRSEKRDLDLASGAAKKLGYFLDGLATLKVTIIN